MLSYYERNKEAVKERVKKYYEQNKEKVQERHRKYYEENKDKLREQSALWQKRNLDKVRERQARWVKNNPERAKEISVKYRLANPDKLKERDASYSRRFPEKVRANGAKREAKKIKAQPGWASEEKMKELYVLARKQTVDTGIVYHVDHVIPLRSNLVCGLHCETNMQIMIGSDNCRKGNRHWPDMP